MRSHANALFNVYKTLICSALLALLPGLAPTAFGDFTVPHHPKQCSHKSFEGVPVNWCITYGDRARNSDILYNYHGSFGGENDWENDPVNELIRETWTKEGIPAPTVITLTFGGEWFLTELKHGAKPALYDLVVQQVMPYIEGTLGGLKGRRLLKGISMGGYNGAQLLLKNGELFDRVALICPVMHEVGPYSTPEEIEDYITRRQPYIKRDWVVDLMNQLRGEFPTLQDYLDHDPLSLVKTRRLKPTRVYLSCGDQDEYGFFEGAREFARIAAANGSQVEWHPTNGGHCVVDGERLARFFAPYRVVPYRD